MKRFLLFLLMAVLFGLSVNAQRVIDKLDRGLIAIKTSGGVYVNWRIQSDEYFDVKYNLYRNGSKIAENLNVSNYTDATGSTSSTYTVAAVVRGVEQEQCEAVTPWGQDYLEIKPDFASTGLKATYVPNDACCVDVDGDGQVEILMKFDNQQEAWAYYQKEGYFNGTFSEYTILACIKLDGTILWWANCGPNMGDFQNNEQNIVGYDWDMDGKGEVIMRLCEGAEVHLADGTTYTVGANGQNGTAWTNYRGIKYTGSGATTATIGYNIASGATVSSNASWCTAKIQNGNLVVSVTENTDKDNGRYATITVNESGKTRTFGFGQPKSGQSSVEWFTYYGNEYLYYCEGATGKPYQCISFPCARLEPGETDLNKAWGDGYGHRSNKFFYGAPYLDGHKPSMFIGRGIYTRHKFVALDVDPSTHQLTQRWRWYNNTNGPWKGQGYHNYGIADVDMDGRDEIIWGSMVIDDNGKGLSTTGLGHGDAQHHGDFDPYTWGLEGFFCNEDQPGNNFRDLTTAKIYYRNTASKDDGRSICGNFNNSYPGCQASSGSDYANAISSVTRAHLPIGTGGMAQNFRIYWDGDLCEETFNYSNGKNTEGSIDNPYRHLATLSGSMTNNDTKGTPCFQGDILGDWREEVIMRTSSNNIRIYSSTYSTNWRNYSLWYDHQYRNAMVWQMCGYNQPPHASYFLGELEGITVAPPSLTMEGRTEVTNGGTISDGDQIITCETNDMTVAVADGATPYIYIDNAPSWVQGYAPQETSMANDPSKITYEYYTHTLTGGAFAGDMRLVKQGEGTLVLPKVTQKYSGNTDVWNGQLTFDGTMEKSRVWLNRHTKLLSNSGAFNGGIEAEYNAEINVAGNDNKGEISVSTLTLNMGAVLALDVYGEGKQMDKVNMTKLVVKQHKDWGEYGPANLTPIIRLNIHYAAGKTTLDGGKYLIGTLSEVEGDLADILLDGLDGTKANLVHENGNLYLNIEGMRDAADVKWTGAASNVWDLGTTKNFSVEGSEDIFATGDVVTFNDEASKYDVNISGEVSPKEVIFDNTKAYTISGDAITGNAAITKKNTGKVTLNNTNNVGNTTIEGGSLFVSSMANSSGTDMGALGTVSKTITLKNGGTLGIAETLTSGQKITASTGNGTIEVASGKTFTQAAAISTANSGELVKTGAGKVAMTGTMSTNLTVKSGSFDYSGATNTKKVTLEGTSSISGAGFITSPISVASGANATLTLTGNNYAAYSGALTGSGTITINPTNTVNRVRITGNWSNFEGTVKVTNTSITFPLDNSNGMPKGTLNLAANTNVSNVAKSYTIGKVTGTGTLREPVSNFQSQSAVSGSNTWKIGNSWEKNGNFTFEGNISDEKGTNKSNFEKVGTCKMTVGKSWTNSGTVKVTEGELHVNGGVTLGTGALTVAAGSTLSGLGATTNTSAKSKLVTNSSVTVNGALQCGSSDTSTGSAFWNFGAKPLTFGTTGTLIVGVGKNATSETSPGCTQIRGGVTGSSVTFKDGATVKVFLASSYTPTATEGNPDKFYYFNDFENVSWGNVNFDLPQLPEHYYWDTADAKTGVLKVCYTSETGIRGIVSTDEVSVEVINTAGVKVANYTSVFSDVNSQFARLSIPKGVYVLRIHNGKNGGSMRVRK